MREVLYKKSMVPGSSDGKCFPGMAVLERMDDVDVSKELSLASLTFA